jgi:casein kinase II subunit beta
MLSNSSGGSTRSNETSWISWFCELDGHEFFAEVEEAYIREEFNLYGLRSRFENYR